MRKMIIHLAPVIGLVMFTPEHTMRNLGMFKSGRYTRLPPIDTDEPIEKVPEEAFDLTNNPSREEERMERYGNGRCLSVGDIVECEGRKWLCLSMGWEEF